MRLRLYHHHDGARVAYRETGTGPALALLHSLGLSHREWEPVVGELSSRFRVVLPDLPLHGDSEDRPRHPYTADWMAEVIAGFCREVAGARPFLAGHDIGAEIALKAVTTGRSQPARLVLLPNRLHRRDEFAGKRAAWRLACRAAAVPGMDLALARGATLVFRPSVGERLSAQQNPAAPQRQLLDAYPRLDLPVLLLWADEDPAHPVIGADEALDLLPNAQLRTLRATGFLMAYDDPVGLARELISFFG